MRKYLVGWLMAMVCGFGCSCFAQAPPITPPGPRVSNGNLAGLLYASNFGQWQIPQGNLGTYSWNAASFCYAQTVSVSFQAFTVGTPIAIVDTGNPSNSEIVTPSAVTIVPASGSYAGTCSITIAPTHPHTIYHYASATAGLQEALNWAGANDYEIVLTPDWALLGGITSMITSASGNTSVSILDQRTANLEYCTWTGAYTCSGFTFVGCVSAGANCSDVTQHGATGNGTTDDTAAIQSVLPQTCSGQKNVVYLPTASSGCYKISAPIVVNPNCTARVEFEGVSASLCQSAANQDALQVSCGTAGACERTGFVLFRPSVQYTGGATTSGAGIRFTGVAPGLSPTPVAVPPAYWNGDDALVEFPYSSGFAHGFENDSWGNLAVYNPVLLAGVDASAAQSITAGSCSGAGSGNCSVTVANASAYSIGSSIWISGANPTALPSLVYPNLLDSQFGILGIGAASGGTVTGTTGQTCLVSNFTTPTITGATATITLTAPVTAGALTYGNSNSIAVTNPGLALQGGGGGAQLSSGTASCTGTAYFYGETIGALPFTVTGVSGNTITYTDSQVSTALTFATGGTNSPTAHAAAPGSAFYLTGSAVNDNYSYKMNLNCGPVGINEWMSGIEMTVGTGFGHVFQIGDTNNCDYQVLAQGSNSADISLGDTETPQGRLIQANGSGVYNITMRNSTQAGLLSPGSPFYSNDAVMHLLSNFNLGGGSPPTFTATSCTKIWGPDYANTCFETAHSQTSSIALPSQPMNYSGNVIPSFTNASRLMLFGGLDYTGTQQDLIGAYRNISNVLTRDFLVWQNGGTINNANLTGTVGGSPTFGAGSTWNGNPLANAFLQNASITIGSVPCTLGSSCSPTGIIGGFLSGFKEECLLTSTTTENCLGTGFVTSQTPCAGETITSIFPASAASPPMIGLASAAASGDSACANGAQSSFWPTQQPTLTWGMGYSATTDYSANSRQWFGLMAYNCTLATMIASDTPVCNYAAIRWSTTAGDTHYECVTDDATGSPTVTAIGTTSPSVAFASPFSISWNASGNVVCTVGTTGVTNTTKLPSTALHYGPIFSNTYPGGGVTNLYLYGWQGISNNTGTPF